MQGIGTDIIEIERIGALLPREAFWRRVYTPAEWDWLKGRGRQQAQSAAGLFCAKEAVAKALGTGFSHGLTLTGIEILHTADGAPTVRVKGRERCVFSLSISHCQAYATATAILWEG